MKVAILIDGGYLRATKKALESKKALEKSNYDAEFIEEFAKKCVEPGETIWRIFYYDCPPREIKKTNDEGIKMPVSGEKVKLSDAKIITKNMLLGKLAQKELFAIRKGFLAFRGWKKRKSAEDKKDLQDEDYKPDFIQKGVDMRIGLDVATLSTKRAVDRIILISGDSDMVPAMKHARIEGLQIVIVKIKNKALRGIHWNLVEHTDLIREIELK